MSRLVRCPNPKCGDLNISYSAYIDQYSCNKCGERFLNLHDPAKHAKILQGPFLPYDCQVCGSSAIKHDMVSNLLHCLNCGNSSHGQHRQSPQGTHSNPSQGSSPVTGGAYPSQSAFQAAQQAALAQQGGLAGAPAWLQGMFGKSPGPQSLAQQLSQLPGSQPAKKIPYAGITLGEILAWRCWRLTQHGFLQSGYKDTIWLPGVAQDAGPKDLDNGWGIHAFKKEASQQLHSAVDEYGAGIEGRDARLPIAIGTVALWGRVIEHDLGYRAEHARVHTIEALAAVPLAEYATRLALLRQSYCPAQPDTQAPNGAAQVKPKQE